MADIEVQIDGAAEAAMAAGAAGRPRGSLTGISGYSSGDAAMPIFTSRRYSSRMGSLDLLKYAESGYTPEEILDVLVDGHPDVSAAVWKLVAMCSSGLKLSAVDANGGPSARGQRWLDMFLSTLAARTSIDGSFVEDRSIKTICVQTVFSLFVTGGAAAEILLDRSKGPIGIWMRPVSRVEFVDNEDGTRTPYWNNGQDKIKLNNDRFIWQVVMPRIDYALPVSPIFPVMSVVFFQIKLLTDAMQIWNKMAPRLDVAFDEKAAIESLRGKMGFGFDLNALRTYIEDVKREFVTSFRTLKPEDPMFHHASMAIKYLESLHGGQIFDMRPMMDMLSQQICSAVKMMPAMLGRTIGKTGTYNAQEAALMKFDISLLRESAGLFLEAAVSRCMQFAGVRATARARFKEVELRSEGEIEIGREKKIPNICREYLLGAITMEEARLELRRDSGTLPPMEEKEFRSWCEKIVESGRATVPAPASNTNENGNDNADADAE